MVVRRTPGDTRGDTRARRASPHKVDTPGTPAATHSRIRTPVVSQVATLERQVATLERQVATLVRQADTPEVSRVATPVRQADTSRRTDSDADDPTSFSDRYADAARSAAYPLTSGAPSRAASAVWSSGIRWDSRSAATRNR